MSQYLYTDSAKDMIAHTEMGDLPAQAPSSYSPGGLPPHLSASPPPPPRPNRRLGDQLAEDQFLYLTIYGPI